MHPRVSALVGILLIILFLNSLNPPMLLASGHEAQPFGKTDLVYDYVQTGSSDDGQTPKNELLVKKVQEPKYSHPSPNGVFFYSPSAREKVNGYIVWGASKEALESFLQRIPTALVKYQYEIVPGAYVQLTEKELRTYSMGLKGLAFVPNQAIFVPAISEEQASSGGFGDTPLDKAKWFFGLSDPGIDFDISGKNIKVGLIDSGINPDVPGLKYFPNGTERPIVLEGSTLLQEKTKTLSDEAGHGTHVATVLVGSGFYYDVINKKIFNSTALQGFLPYAELYSIRVLNASGFGELAWILEGLEVAKDLKLDVINMSFGSGVYNGTRDLIGIAIDEIWDDGNGPVLVAAAGNEGPMGTSIGSPAVISNVIAVGGFADKGENGFVMYSASSWGPGFNSRLGAPGIPKPDVIGAAVNVWGLDYQTGDWRKLSGTSLAAPMIVGLAGLLRSEFPQATSPQIVTALLKSAEDPVDSVERQGVGVPQLPLAHDYLEAMVNGNETHPMIAVNPPRIDTNNIVFSSEVIGFNKTFFIGIYASETTTIRFNHTNMIDFQVSFDTDSQDLIVLRGYNYFELTIKIQTETMLPIEDTFEILVANSTNGDNLKPGAHIKIFSVPQFPQGKVLFDASKDADTPFGYYLGDNSMGKFSYMSKLLERDGFHVESNFKSTLEPPILDGFNILVISDPDKPYSTNELNYIKEFINNGGSVVIFAWGLNTHSENFYHGNAEIDSINQITKGYGFTFAQENSSADIIYAETTDAFGEGIIPLVQWGPEISVHDPDKTTILLTDYKGPLFRAFGSQIQDVYGIMANTSSNSYVVGFSSSYLFDNFQLRTGYGLVDVLPLREYLVKLFETIIRPQQPIVDVTIQGSKNKGEELTFIVQYKNNKGIPLSLPDSPRKAFIVRPDYGIVNSSIFPVDPEKGVFGAKYPGEIFNIYGTYYFYAPIQIDGMVPSNGKFTFKITEPYWEQKQYIYYYSTTLLLSLLLASVLMAHHERLRRAKQAKAKRQTLKISQ